MLRFDRLNAPSKDGDILIEPAARDWPRLVKDNRHAQADHCFQLAGMDVRTLRKQFRADVLGLTDDTPVIAAGHQPEFVHPGVWAKHILVRAFTSAVDACGVNLVVDNDSPFSSSLLVPAVDSDGMVRTKPITFAQGPVGAAFEGRPTLSETDLKTIRDRFERIPGEHLAKSMIWPYLDGLTQHLDAADAVDQHLAARWPVDVSLGADLHELRISQVLSPRFVVDCLAHSGRFASAYNESLADYRRQHGIRSPDRPLPDLQHRDNRQETAFWVYQRLKPRRRLWVSPDHGKLSLYADEIRIATLSESDLLHDPESALAELQPWLIRPRALTLTLWARLIACDLFVHGIGGAKYDRITDGIFRKYYRCEPPAYTCVSATLRLPLPEFSATDADLASARHRVRDWQYNPNRYLPDPPQDLLGQRTELIHRSKELRTRRAPRPARKEVFLSIRRLNALLSESGRDIGRQLADQYRQRQQQSTSNQAAESREYFYLLQPRERLDMLASRLRNAAEVSKR